MTFPLPANRVIQQNGVNLETNDIEISSLAKLPSELFEKILVLIGKDSWVTLRRISHSMNHLEGNSVYWKTFAQKVGIIPAACAEDQNQRLEKYGINPEDIEKWKLGTTREKIKALVSSNLHCLYRYKLYDLHHEEMQNPYLFEKLNNFVLTCIKSGQDKNPDLKNIFRKHISLYSQNMTFKTKSYTPPQGIIPRYECHENKLKAHFTRLSKTIKNDDNLSELNLLELFSATQYSFSADMDRIVKNQLSERIKNFKKLSQNKLAALGELYLAKVYCYDLSAPDTINTVHHLLKPILNSTQAPKYVVDEAKFLFAMLCFEPGGQPDSFSDEELTELLIDLNDKGKLCPIYQVWVKMYLCMLLYQERTTLIDNAKALDLLYEIPQKPLDNKLHEFTQIFGNLFEVRCGSGSLKCNIDPFLLAKLDDKFKNIAYFVNSVQTLRGNSLSVNYLEAKNILNSLINKKLLANEDHAIALATLEKAEELLKLCDHEGMITDQSHMLQMLNRDPNFIDIASTKLLNNPNFFLEAIKINFETQTKIPSFLYKDDKFTQSLIEYFLVIVQRAEVTKQFTDVEKIPDRICLILQRTSSTLRSNVDFANSLLTIFNLLLEIFEKYSHVAIELHTLLALYSYVQLYIQKNCDQHKIYNKRFLLRALSLETCKFLSFFSTVPEEYLKDEIFVLELLKTNPKKIRDLLCGENPKNIFDINFMENLANTYLDSNEISEGTKFDFKELSIHFDILATMIALMPISEKGIEFANRVDQMIQKMKTCMALTTTVKSSQQMFIFTSARQSLLTYFSKVPTAI